MSPESNTLISASLVTGAFELPGYRVVRNCGIVRGIVVRSRSLLGNFAAGLQTIVGGNIAVLTELCENTREEAYDLMVEHAVEHGANAIIGMRYDATEIMQGVTEVLAYGTAVRVEPASS
ncbi:MAG: YbjQ family protein [Candidatus Acidiferrales bacterium]